MKTKFAAIIGMILMISAALPAQAAEAGATAAFSGSKNISVTVEMADNAYNANAFKYLGNGWHYRDGSWFYVRSGKAVTGWVKDGGKWYFLDKNGRMKTGWIKDNGKWYYLNSSGAMKTGWIKDGGKKYYLASNGQMKTGWLKLKGKTYYLTKSGARKTGWLKLNGKKYYFKSNGVLDAQKTREANAVTSTLEAASTKSAAKTTATTSKTATVKTSKAKTKGELITEYALQFVGNPYVYGGCSLTNGTDCSGFVMLIYRHFGVSLPHYDAAIRVLGTEVRSLSEAKAGDVICYYGHVAIYLGDGRIVHASNSRDGIKISERADYRTIASIRRFFN